MVERGIIFPVLSLKGKWGRPFPLLVPGVMFETHRKKRTMTKICICWRAQYIAPLWAGQDPQHMNSCDSSFPLVYLSVSSMVQRTLCVYLYTKRSLLATVVFGYLAQAPRPEGGGTDWSGESVFFTLLPDCWVTLGSLQLLHLSPPQFL